MSISTLKRAAVAVAVLGVVGVGGAVAVKQNAAVAAVATPAAVTTAPAAVPAPTMTLPDFSVIAAHNGPAVVNINVTGSTKTAYDGGGQQGRNDQFADDPFYEFFRRFQQGQQGGQRGQRAQPTHGLGSGFIISSDGIILTNAHVVRDASEVVVKLTDRREFRAKVLGSDPQSDVAVLKIDANNLPVVPLAKGNDLKVGEWVLAIGSPYGLDNTVTAGVVSAKGRSLPDGNVPFIQTDVAVNPGNSGGPLFNTRGEVVGINSQIYSQTGGYQGLSFAIPIDVANKIKNQIVATGKVVHAKLGVTVQEVNQGFADSFNLATPEGALISNVERGGPADKAGLKAGDVILALNGQKIVSSVDLPSMVGLSTPGEKITLDVWRQGKPVQIAATLGNAKDKVVAQDDGPVDQASAKLRLGLSLRQLDAAERRESGIASGLLIQDAGGAAANAGVQPGDVLLSVNGRPVNSVEQVRDVVGKAGKSVALLIQRGDDKIFIPVRLG
ncbi:Do family serine endopeptidase [Duganella sp. FT135W]|uniref:Probable periplasmic serine endoprotease DegP-like n=1 Tax=Duganella flavida TaxID=2692175 RepID=A0A6L8KKU3_9BURK|nr:Do family serine endopeptidase [Duganella flavida]MYM25181.1 Do family serine endopeptidase [Duganella flavida]